MSFESDDQRKAVMAKLNKNGGNVKSSDIEIKIDIPGSQPGNKMLQPEQPREPRFKQVQIWKYDEAPEDLKKKILERYRRINTEDMPLFEEDMTEKTKDLLGKNKIKVDSDLKVRYSLGYSQGDGASFTGKFTWKGYDVTVEPATHHYVHYNSVSHNLQKLNRSGTDYVDAPEKVLESWKSLYKDICEDLEKFGYDEIEYQESDKAIIETIESNDYDFNSSGKIA